MLKQNVDIITRCISLKNSWGGVKPLLYSLALSTALVSPTFAEITPPEINVDYLNELTGPKVTWETANESDSDIVFINGAYYKYTYHKPDDYSETSTRLDDNLDETNTQSVVFKDIAYISDSYAYGGAIYNNSIFDKPLNADFVGNNAHGDANDAYGGAFYNRGTIGDITGNFIGNYAYSTGNYNNAHGGAIYNYDDASIGDITGDFIGNYAHSGRYANGGAIYNTDTIGDITGNFIGNYIYSTDSGYNYGGAIYNTDTIGDITGNFIGNYIYSTDSSYNHGGAIYNDNGSIGNITGDFIGNYVYGGAHACGGAIDNGYDGYEGYKGIIGDITGDFVGNYIKSSHGDGGAIYNRDSIGNITGDFIGNYVYGEGYARGGAIFNTSHLATGTIGNITGNFIGNYAYGGEMAAGGAIYNDHGGTVYIGNRSNIGDITGNFIGNYAYGESDAHGGAIYNHDSFIGDLTGDFISNYAQANDGSAEGGTIYNEGGAIGDITGNFIGNYVHSEQRALGGAIYNEGGTIDDITGNFIGNYVHSGQRALGGAIYNDYRGSNKGIIGDITGDFIGNYAYGESDAHGGAIYNEGGTMSFFNSNFHNNYSQTETTNKSYAQGGAIYNISGSLNVTANDGKQSVFSGNKVIYKDDEGNDIEESNAIHMAGGTLNLSAIEGGQIIFDDKITAKKGTTNTASVPINILSYTNLEGDASTITPEAMFLSSEQIGNNLEAFLDATVADAIQNGMDASWEQKNDKYIFTGKYGDDTNYEYQRIELTAFDELNGYTGEVYQGLVSFATSDLYGSDLKAYLDTAIADGMITSYTEKDGVYYATMIQGSETIDVTFKEDTEAGGAWMTMEQSAIQKETEIIPSEQYNGDMKEFLTAQGIQFIEKDGYYYTAIDDTLVKIDTSIDGYMDKNGNYIEKDIAEQIFAEAKANGDEISIVDGVVTISTKSYTGESGVFYQDDNGDVLFHGDMVNNVKFNINGDGTGKVVFNDDIEHDGTITVSNAEVDINAQGFDRANLKDGSVVNVGNGFVIKDTIINSSSLLKIKEGAKALSTMIADSGTLSVQNGGEVDNTVVFSGGILHVDTNGIANDTTVNSGGKLETEISAKLNNLLANGGAILDIDAGSVLTGNIIIDANAEMGGSYDYSKIFKDEVTDSGSLTLVGGLNDAMTSDSLINDVADKKLNLTSGDYYVGYGAQTVSGWDSLTISDATVKVEGVIDMADASKVINVTSNSTLDLAGHSPLVTTIIGSVNNDGTLNFHHADDDADDITNIYGNYTAYNNAQMIIDVNPSTKSSDLMIVDGDVAGTTKVTVYKISDGTTTDLIKFVDAPNDDTSTGAYFTVHRVYAEALDITDQWKIVHQDNAWHITSADNPTNSNDGYGTSDTGDLDVDIVTDVTLPNNFPTSPTIKPNIPTNNQTSNNDTKTKLVSEALAYISLPKVGLEQVRDLVRIVSNKVTSTKIKSGRCGMGECNYDGQAVNGAWIDLGHKKSEIDAPVAVEAKINAVDLGFDIQKDLHNRLGIFASYRQGEYELSGDGEDYYSKVGSDINIDSWILGLYHRYDYGRLWTMSSIYGGIQKVDMSTDDGVSADTDGMQFGGSIEAGLVFEPQKRLTIEPSIRLGYNFIKYDDMSDSYGKTAEFDNVQNIEAEAGVKIEKTFFHNNRRVISKIYVKPSIIQNFGKGDVNITSLDTVEGLENETLIRGEIGGSFNFGNGWSGFGAVGYTYGSDYNATDFNVGVNYNW